VTKLGQQQIAGNKGTGKEPGLWHREGQIAGLEGKGCFHEQRLSEQTDKRLSGLENKSVRRPFRLLQRNTKMLKAAVKSNKSAEKMLSFEPCCHHFDKVYATSFNTQSPFYVHTFITPFYVPATPHRSVHLCSCRHGHHHESCLVAG
jgi:hypothetical protein